MKRWVLIAAMGLAAAGGIVTPNAAQASSAAWYQVVQSSATGEFSDIAAISPANIWAVGDTWTAAGTAIYTPFVRHFNGSTWQDIFLPKGSTSDWVSASAANNVWVGGLNNASSGTSVVYRYNGATWTRIPVPATTFLQGVAVLSPDNVWAFGSSGTIYDDIFHWNGIKWQGYLTNTVNFMPEGISASSANNVWVSGFSYVGSKKIASAYRWNGKTWQWVLMPHPVLADGTTVTTLAAYDTWIGYNTSSTSYALDWNGHAWRTYATPYYATSSNILPDGHGGWWFGPQAILTGTTWTMKTVPEFTGSGNVTRIPGTTSFLMPTEVDTAGGTAGERPAIYRFDL